MAWPKYRLYYVTGEARPRGAKPNQRWFADTIVIEATSRWAARFAAVQQWSRWGFHVRNLKVHTVERGNLLRDLLTWIRTTLCSR